MKNINIKDKKYSRWYKNCKRQRKVGAKICNACPFRPLIERQELGGSWQTKDEFARRRK